LYEGKGKVRDSSGLRLPVFIGIGPPRTGTTWLHHALDGVAGLPIEKETRFFTERHHKGIEWYARRFKDSPARNAIGEICPSYFASIEAIERIHAYIPDCKIICTFRDPVQRAYSNYKLMRRMALTQATFEDALVTHDEIWESNRYGFYLRKWRAHFGADRVLVTLFDDLIHEPQAYVNRICKFVGANTVVLTERNFSPGARNEIEYQPTPAGARLAQAVHILRSWLEEHEMTGLLKLVRGWGAFRYFVEHGNPFPALDPKLESRVRERFRGDVDELEDLIGRDLSSWKRGGDDTSYQINCQLSGRSLSRRDSNHVSAIRGFESFRARNKKRSH
jgi:Sulfotransferase family